jgi:AcrR family transcriptional regulator
MRGSNYLLLYTLHDLAAAEPAATGVSKGATMSISVPAHGPRTGRPARFTGEDAVHAALDLGIADFSLAQVARRLGVTTPALYRVFPSRDALVEACLHRIFDPLPLPDGDAHWRTLLDGFGTQLWEQFTRNPGLHEVFAQFPKPPVSYHPGLRALYPVLEEKGYSRDQTTFATMTIMEITAAVVGLLHRQQRYLAAATSAGPHFRSPSGLPLTTSAGLTVYAAPQWRVSLDFFLDQLAASDPDWPAWVGAYQVR